MLFAPLQVQVNNIDQNLEIYFCQLDNMVRSCGTLLTPKKVEDSTSNGNNPPSKQIESEEDVPGTPFHVQIMVMSSTLTTMRLCSKRSFHGLQ